MYVIGRLSKEEIERMVKNAEQYKEEDEKQRDRVTAKNSLESYSFNMKSSVEDEKLKDKISDEDRQKVLDKCNEVIRWLDSNQVNWPALYFYWFRVCYLITIFICNFAESNAYFII